jgi:hypothetical protein
VSFEVLCFLWSGLGFGSVDSARVKVVCFERDSPLPGSVDSAGVKGVCFERDAPFLGSVVSTGLRQEGGGLLQARRDGVKLTTAYGNTKVMLSQYHN